MQAMNWYNARKLRIFPQTPATFVAALAICQLWHCPSAFACGPQITLELSGVPAAENMELPWPTITVKSSGGPEGATVSLQWSSTGTGTVEFWDSSYNQLSGNQVSCPPNDQDGTTFFVRGVDASSEENDISLTAQWVYDNQVLFEITTTVSVVTIGEVQFRLSTQTEWRRYVDKIYVLAGDQVNFKAIPKPGQSWPANRPKWDGEGGQATGATHDVTFTTAGDKTVIVYSDVNTTLNITVLAADDVVVDFSKSEVRPGVSGAAREEEVIATARRANGGPQVTVELSTDNARATVTEPAPVPPATVSTFTLPQGQATTQATATVKVRGATSSPANRDTKLLAKVGGVPKGSIPVTVVYPKKWSNDCLGKWSFCRQYTLNDLKNGQWTVQWTIPVTFTVKDNWGETLHSQWSGVLIWERYPAIPGSTWTGFDTDHPTQGTAINASGNAVDPVAWVCPVLTTEQKDVVVYNLDHKLGQWPYNVWLQDRRIEYKITDGDSLTYSLEQENKRTFIRLGYTDNNDHKVMDSK